MFIIIILLLSCLWPSLWVFYSRNYNKVLFCRAVTPFRLFFRQLLWCSFFTLASLQCIYPSSFMSEHSLQQCIVPFYRGKADDIGGHDKKVCMGGTLIFPVKVGVHYKELSESKAYRLLLQSHHHFILYSQGPILITSLLITPKGKADWLLDLFISETKLSESRKVCRAKFEPARLYFVLSQSWHPLTQS